MGTKMMRGNLRSGALAVLLAGAAFAQPAMAADMIPGGEEDVKIIVGGVLARIDASIGVNGTTNNGSPVDLSSGNASKNAGNIFFGAEWRFANRHRVTGMYFTTKKERTLSLDEPVTIGDDTLVPPTTLDSETRNRFLFLTYQWSFVKTKDVEIGALLGAYLNKFDANLSGTATVTNSSGVTTVNKSVVYEPSVTVPMPLIGASINWYVSPSFTVQGSLSGLKAKIGDVDGSVYVATVGVEYMFTRNFGAGLNLMHTKVDVDVTKPRFDGSINWKNDNVLLYALLKF
jgi:hypothetical protein